MFESFEDIINSLSRMSRKKVVAVAAAQDHEVLECAVEARKKGLADFILTGDAARIKEILAGLGSPDGDWEIIDEPDENAAAKIAARLVAEGRADVPMKGLLHTAAFLRQVFNKELGLVAEGALVSEITVTEFPWEKRLILVTDCAINVAPDYAAKLKIAANAISLAQKLGIGEPRLAVVAAVETVNPAMPETIDAAMISKAAQRGQLKGAVVDGPLALDNALSMEAARTKGIDGPVAGRADILLMPDLAAGNVLDKALRYFGRLKTGGAIMGAKVPLIVTSRSDSAENKLHAVALSTFVS